MIRRRLLLVCALLVLCAFFLHIAAMRPTAEELRRAEALEAMLAGEASAPLTEPRDTAAYGGMRIELCEKRDARSAS